jgi:hypothetical protein
MALQSFGERQDVGESSYPVRGAWLGLLEGSCDV